MSMTPTAAFQWHDDDAVIVRSQPAIAVYSNRAGAIVVRQEAAWDDDSDAFIIVQRQNAPALVRAILAEAGAEAGELVGNKRQGQTAAAERQRRYRQRKRDAGVTGDASVTGDAHG